MLKRLPGFVDPLRYAEEGKRLQGEIDITEMDRLKASVSRAKACVKLNMSFGMDELKNKFIDGHMQTELTLICQRCLQDMTVTIKRDFLLGLVRNVKQADALPHGYEPLMVNLTTVKLAAIIEDELILALPIVPMHAASQCQAVAHSQATDEAAVKPSPFSVLKQMAKAKS